MRIKFNWWLPALITAGFFISARVDAGHYTIVNVADTSTPAPVGNFTSFASQPAIGVAFNGNYAGGSGVFSWIPSSQTTIAKSGDPAPTGTFSGFGGTANRGATSFLGFYGRSFGIFRGDGGPLTTIAKTGDAAPSGTFTTFGSPAVEASAQFSLPLPALTAFRGIYASGSGIFLGSGGALTTMIKTGDPAPSGTFGVFGDLSLSSVNGSGGIPVPAVAFGAGFDGSAGIFTLSNGTLTTIATTATLPAASFGDPYILHSHVAFLINPHTANQAIYSDISGSLAPVVSAGQPAPVGNFTSFGDPLLTFSGIAFEAFYDGGDGIFARADSPARLNPSLKPATRCSGACLIGDDGTFRWLEQSLWSRRGWHRRLHRLVHARQRQVGHCFISALPEPTTLSLLAVAALCIGRVRFRSRKY